MRCAVPAPMARALALAAVFWAGAPAAKAASGRELSASPLLHAARGASAVSEGGLQHGDLVYLTVGRTMHRVTVMWDGRVHAKWTHKGSWERFLLERDAGPGEVRSGDIVLLKGWKGKRLTVMGRHLHARWAHAGSWQRFVIETKSGGSDVVLSGSTVFLKAHTGRRVDADSPISRGMVLARWYDQGLWQQITIEAHGPAMAVDATTSTSTESPTTSTTDLPTTPTTTAPLTTPTGAQLPLTSTPTTTRDIPTGSTPTTAGLPSCGALTADSLAQAVEVTTLSLPSPMGSNCKGLDVERSCRHGFYAASPRSDLHALLYNDASGTALLVLISAGGAVVATKGLGEEEVRGLQFEPSARHLVALISGGTGVHGSPSFFVKMRMPDLEVVWSRPIQSRMVGMEMWTPDNSDTIAVSDELYMLHSAGVCHDGAWCARYQGDIVQALNATTGEGVRDVSRDWQASHSCRQMVAYNEMSDSFLMGSAGDYSPKALLFTAFTRGAHAAARTRFEGWGDGAGRQGVAQGAIKAEPLSPGFASVWSFASKLGEPHKLHFARLHSDGAWSAPPRRVFPGSVGAELGANLAPLDGGRWLVAYTEAPGSAVTDAAAMFWDDWGLEEDTRARGSRLAILDASGDVLGAPADISAVGAPFPVEINHLAKRAEGFGWIYIDGPGAATARVAHLRCRHAVI